MLAKRIGIAVFAVLVVFCWIEHLQAHCHDVERNPETGEDEPSCEDLPGDLVSNEYWSTTQNNTVTYEINVTYKVGLPPAKRPYPKLDVQIAASRWDRIRYTNEEGETRNIKFGLAFDGETTRKSNVIDGVNVVAYGHLPWSAGNRIAGRVYYDHYDAPYSNRIKECDMRLNYYAPFDKHPHVGPGELCIRNIAAHEFGHFLKLNDLKTTHGCTTPYSRYTMWGYWTYADHDMESLECEDKWAAYYKYGFIK